MVASWAFIYEQPGADPTTDRFVVDRDGQRTTLVPVPDASRAPEVALSLIHDGVELIELCGGFSLSSVAQVLDAVAGRVPVGHVTYAVNSTGGPAYNASSAAELPPAQV